MLLARDSALAATARLMRSHGMTTMSWDRFSGHAWDYDVRGPGYNYRPSELSGRWGARSCGSCRQQRAPSRAARGLRRPPRRRSGHLDAIPGAGGRRAPRGGPGRAGPSGTSCAAGSPTRASRRASTIRRFIFLPLPRDLRPVAGRPPHHRGCRGPCSDASAVSDHGNGQRRQGVRRDLSFLRASSPTGP